MINNNSLSFQNTKNLPASISVPGLARPDCVSLTEERRGEKTGMTKVWVELENKFLFEENCQVRMLSRSFNIINVPSVLSVGLTQHFPWYRIHWQFSNTLQGLKSWIVHGWQCFKVCPGGGFIPPTVSITHFCPYLELPEILPSHWYLLTFIWDLHQIISGAN